MSDDHTHGWLPCSACGGDHYVEDCTDPKSSARYWSDEDDDNDDDDDVEICNGYSEHRGVRTTHEDADGIAWECTSCGAEGWEDYENDG